MLIRIMLLVVVCAGCCGETDSEIADRVNKKRAEFASVGGVSIVSMNDDQYRTTLIVLSDGRKILVKSTKHSHKTTVVDEHMVVE